ncbi:MAG TPA: tetratricopeptide repeat-containing sensor histidine kinase [Prolixibacteraceae bacterium]|nr:tetratricopeptide repeat-containing sensor histidine kinase [Prolixibacteraceae bacterium]
MNCIKTLPFFFPLFIFSIPAVSVTDSLQALYNQQSGLEKIHTGIELTGQMEEDPAALLSFSLQLLDEAGKICPKTLLHARTARAVGDAFYYTDSLGRSNEYLLIAVSIAENLEPVDTFFLGSLYNDIGTNYLTLDENSRARYYTEKAVSFFEGSSYRSQLANAKNDMAVIFHGEGNYEEAISLLQDVYQIDLESGNKRDISTSLNNLGRMYIDWGKYETGLDYYLQSLGLLDSLSDHRTLGIRYNNIGMVYQMMKNHPEAIQWFNKAIETESPYGQTPRLAIRYYNIGNSYMAQLKREEAKINFEKAYAIFQAAGLIPQLSKVSGSLGQLYVNMGLPEKAAPWLMKSKDYAEQAGILPELAICYRHLYEFYKAQGRYKESLNFYELYAQANDSIFNLNVSRQVEEMDAKYQTQQKQTEIERLEAENQLTQKEVAFKKRQRNFAFIGIAFLLMVSLSLYYLLTLLRKQKKQVEKQNAELDRLNKTLNRLFAIISHDLRNATAAYQSSAKVIAHHLNKGQPEKLLPIAADISANAGNLSAMLENLLQWSVIQMKGLIPRKELLNIREEAEKAAALLQADAAKKENTITLDIEPGQMLYCDRESLSLVLRNLLGNANKFTEKGTIRIRSEKRGQELLLSVSDTGCGMDKGMVDTLFGNHNENIRKGTAGEKGTGLGMVMVKEHVEKNGGNIAVESDPDGKSGGKGTTFVVSFPIEDI